MARAGWLTVVGCWVLCAAVVGAAVGQVPGSPPGTRASGPAGGALSAPARATTQPAVEVAVDPRVELMSIIFRLAGNPEYSRPRVPSYARDAQEHFGPHADHAVVQLARRLRASQGVSYDAPMSMVPHLSDAIGLKERVPFEPYPEGLDQRWRLEGARGFLREARQFVQVAKAQEFFDAHAGLYRLAAERMDKTLKDDGHLEWFDEFFGRRGATFRVYLGMLNGGACYGAHFTDGNAMEMYCILGVWQTDANGLPAFSKDVLPTVVHEFCHSYVNPSVYRHAKQLEPAGTKLFAQTKDAMRRQAYGNWTTMIHESLVRACVVRYRLAHEGAEAAKAEIASNKARGFAWVGELADLLGQYEKDRATYGDLESFMPRVIEFFNAQAETRAQ